MFGNRETGIWQKKFCLQSLILYPLQSCLSCNVEGILQGTTGFVMDNVEFVDCNSEFATCLVCFALSLSTAVVGFLIKIQGLPFVMKQIIHDCDAVPKTLNALVVCSSNIYITKVNYLPNWKKKKELHLK